MIRAAALLLLPLVAACQSHAVCTPAGVVSAAAGPPPPDWHAAASDPDHVKLREERDAFLEGVAAARAKGFGPQLDAAGRLFEVDYAQDGAALPPGDYRCRIVTLGTRTAGRPPFVSDQGHHCAVTAGTPLNHFDLTDGPQRLTGRIYPDTPSRQVFLGVIQLADEPLPLKYGRDIDRDTVGAVQRVGPDRWRMVVPRPAWVGTVKVIEIVPLAGRTAQAAASAGAPAADSRFN